MCGVVEATTERKTRESLIPLKGAGCRLPGLQAGKRQEHQIWNGFSALRRPSGDASHLEIVFVPFCFQSSVHRVVGKAQSEQSDDLAEFMKTLLSPCSPMQCLKNLP